MVRGLKHQRGSVMVEFALIAPMLVLILIGIMVMGVIINSKIVVAGAAREAGRTWAIVKDDQTARAKATDAIIGGGLKANADGQVLFSPAQDVAFVRQGDYIHVTVTYRQPTFVPMLAQLLGSGGNGTLLPLRSQAIFRVER